MLHPITFLVGKSLHAKDGEIGTVDDLYFDDEAWAVRHLAVDTGTWLSGRRVLISPCSVTTAHWDQKVISVDLTKNEIENSPNIDTHEPISRQHEAKFYDYYGYPYYWPGPYLWGPVAYPGALPRQPTTQEKELRAIQEKKRLQDQHLRSIQEVKGYDIQASDGEIGHIEDFLIDDHTWAIRYIVVDTRNWWPGKKVIVPPQWISSISWTDGNVHVDLSRAAIKRAPEYDEQQGVTRDYETRIYRHYSRPPYWQEEHNPKTAHG